MHDLLNDSDLSTVHLMAPRIIGCPSRWTSTALQIEQSCISKSISLKMSTPPHCQSAKQLGFYFQDQDSSSTQSTGQSYPGVARVGESNPYGQTILSVNTRCNGSPGKLEEVHNKSALLKGTQDCVFPPQVDYRQQYACVPLSHPEPYYHGLLSAYGPQSMMMGVVASPRVPLPLDLTQDEPIYVNAKQYNAILRRRQYRAKLEAQNKVSKNRKPYLHESRHLHALKRARGSGGRFLSMKKLAESALDATRSEQQDVSRSSWLQTTKKMLASELYHPTQEYKEAPTTNSCSDMRTVSNNASILQQQESRFSGYNPSLVGRPMQGGGAGLPGGIQHHLSVIR